jgi:hypothetical protein
MFLYGFSHSAEVIVIVEIPDLVCLKSVVDVGLGELTLFYLLFCVLSGFVVREDEVISRLIP